MSNPSLAFVRGLGRVLSKFIAGVVLASTLSACGYNAMQTQDEAANAAHGPKISTPASKIGVWVIPTDEEKMIARHTRAVLAKPNAA